MLHPIKPEYVIPKLLGDRRGTVRGGRRESDHEPKRGWVPAFTIALGIALADWIVKAWVAYTVPVEGFRPLGSRVALWHVQNHAMILGLWDNFPLGTRKVIAVVASVLGSLVLLQIVGRGHRFTHGQRRWAWLFVGLVLGGMLGNLGERVVHWAVTDYLSFRWGDVWLPPGNVADIALFLSIPLAVPVIAFEVLGRMRRGRTEQQTVTLREVEAEPSV